MIILRVFAALLTYPRGEMFDALPEISTSITASEHLGAAEKERVARLIIDLSTTDPFELEERYVDLFDRNRSTSLHLFEHIHGDSRERGQAMVDLKAIYERAGLQLASNELPDYLPAMLEYLSCRTLAEARDMLGDCAHVIRAIGNRVAGRGSGYAAVFDALLAIAREPGLDWPTVSEPQEVTGHVDRVDEDWMEAPAFGPGPAQSRAEPGVVPLQYMPRGTRQPGG